MNYKFYSQRIFYLFLISFIFTALSLTLVSAQEPVGSYEGSLVVGTQGGYVYLGGPGATPVCGNSVIESGEQCDSNNLNGQTCGSLLGTGYTGSLSCNTCVWETNLCVAPTPSSPSSGGSGGGGGSSGGVRQVTSQCVENWQCDSWSACLNDKQVRFCEDKNECGTTEVAPDTQRGCESEIPEEVMEETLSESSSITGAAIGAQQATLFGIYALAIILAIGGSLYIRSRMIKKK